MLNNFLEPAVLCFLLGLFAGIFKSDLRVPEAICDMLSIYLLFSIGLSGGLKLSQHHESGMLLPLVGTFLLAIAITLIAYALLRSLVNLDSVNASAVAAHYGSTSVMTFAVAQGYLTRLGVSYESYTTILMVVMEVPALIVGVSLAKRCDPSAASKGSISKLLREALFGKSIYLLLGGMLVGYLSGPERMEPLGKLFFDLFKGALALFLLEMGIVASKRLIDLRHIGFRLVAFAVGMPLLAGLLGATVGELAGLSVGGATLLATLSASSSYIAAPAAMRVALPQANPTLYFTASLGVTFPFNIAIGVPIYYWLAQHLQHLVA